MQKALLRGLLHGDVPALPSEEDGLFFDQLLMGGWCVLSFLRGDGGTVWQGAEETAEAESTERIRCMGCPEEDGSFSVLVSFVSRRDYEARSMERLKARLTEALSAQLSVRLASGAGGFAPCYELMDFSRREALIAARSVLASGHVRAVLDYIGEKLTDPGLSNAGASQAAYLNYSYMCTVFRQQLGVTVNRYIRMRRVRYALMLLEQKSVSDAALASGYKDPKFFSRSLRAELGFSPAWYQKRTAGSRT